MSPENKPKKHSKSIETSAISPQKSYKILPNYNSVNDEEDLEYQRTYKPLAPINGVLLHSNPKLRPSELNSM